jgi:hypothetical protein
MSNFIGKLHDVFNYEILRSFLLNPRDKKSFKLFFEFCFRHVVGYLRYLRAKGATFEMHDADEHKSLMDITYDILGDFLKSEDNRPFYIIFDYFNRQKITNYDNIDPDVLYDHFTILLRGFVRKALYKRRREQNPQAGNLERRIIDILKGDNYHVFRSNPDDPEYVSLSDSKNKLRRECQPYTLDDLLKIVYKALSDNETNNRVEWVNNIFGELAIASEFQNFVKKYDLIRTIIHVNNGFVESEGGGILDFPPPDTMGHRREIDKSKTKSYEYAKKGLNNYTEKGRITCHEAELFLLAVEKYLADFAFDGQTDKIPTYFFEIMPGCSQEKYLKKYKYVFETIINSTRDDFIDRLINIL